MCVCIYACMHHSSHETWQVQINPEHNAEFSPPRDMFSYLMSVLRPMVSPSPSLLYWALLPLPGCSQGRVPENNLSSSEYITCRYFAG